LVAKWPGGGSVIKPSVYISNIDLRVRLVPTMLCVEMALMAILHILAYPAAPYNIESKEYLAELPESGRLGPYHYQGGFLGFKAVLDASNPWDQIKAMGRGLRWLLFSRRNRENDSSYVVGAYTSIHNPQFPTHAENQEPGSSPEYLWRG